MLDAPLAAATPTRDTVRYDVLDGARGIAALGVVVFHFSIIGLPHALPRGYLFVDLFFVLSGFVLSHSYERRLSVMGLSRFARLRLVRLMPLSVFGVLFGSAYFVSRALLTSDSQYSFSDIFLGSTFNLFLLPKPWSTPTPTDTIFPTNTPLWSLSAELIINLLWAAGAYRLSSGALLRALVPTGLLLLLFIAWHGSADLGATWPTYLGGLLRAAFGFGAGVLIWRHRAQPFRSELAPWAVMGLMTAALLAPSGGWAIEALFLLVATPASIYVMSALAAPKQAQIFAFLGRISFPIYVIHLPLLMLTVGIFKYFQLTWPPTYVGLALIPVIIVAAVLLDTIYDKPVRKFLTPYNADRKVRIQPT